MGFSIGDKIMHPKFGVGMITGESRRELVKGFEHYYVINVVGTGATAYVPVRKMDELGVRRVMSRDKLGQVFNILRGTPSELSTDYKLRQARVQEQLETRRPIQVAKAVRDLTWHRIRKRLTQKDETLLSQGRDLLASEMALATDTQIADAEQTIETVLTVATTSEPDGKAVLQETDANLELTSEALVQKLLDGVTGDQGVSTYA